MLSLRVTSTVMVLMATRLALVAGQDLPSCLNLSQYERGLCCMPGKACPYDGPPPPPPSDDDAVPTYAVPEVWCLASDYANECLDSNCAGEGFKAICGDKGMCVCAAADEGNGGVGGGAPIQEQPAPEVQPPQPEEKPADKVITLPNQPGRPGVVVTIPEMPACSSDQDCQGDAICKGDMIATCAQNGDVKQCACKEKEKQPTAAVEEKPSTTTEAEKISKTTDEFAEYTSPPRPGCECIVEDGGNERCLCPNAKKPEKTCRRSSDCVSTTCADNEQKSCKDGRCECIQKFTSGKCRLHLTHLGDNNRHRAHIKVWDGAGKEIGEKTQPGPEDWGTTVSVPQDNKLPYDVSLEFVKGRVNKRKRDRPTTQGDHPLQFTTWGIRFTAGKTKWTTEFTNKDKMPYCEIGGWDVKDTWGSIPNPIDALAEAGTAHQKQGAPEKKEADPTNSQDMDCYWAC